MHHRDADVVERLPGGHRAGSRQRLHHRSRRAAIAPRFDGAGTGLRKRSLQLGVRGNRDAGFLRRDREDHAAVVHEQRLGQRRRIVRRHRRQQLLHEAELVLDAGTRLVVQEVADVFLRERAAFGLGPFAVSLFVKRGHPLLRAIHFRSAESELAHALGFRGDHTDAIFELAVLDRGTHRKRRDVPTEAAAADPGAKELRVGLLRQLRETLVHHVFDGPLHQIAAVVGDFLLAFALPLPLDADRRSGQFRVGHDADERVLLERNRSIGKRSGRRAVGQWREVRLDRLLDGRGLDVADGNHRHSFRSIPGVVKGAQPRDRCVADDVWFANRQPLRIARLIEQNRKLLVAHARTGAETAAPLFDDHAAFLVHFDRRQRQPAGKVSERGQRLLDDFGFVARDVEHVDRFVERCVGVDVGSQPRADRFEVRHQLTRLEVCAPVEGHVLDEMRETLLIVGLVDRPCTNRQAQRDAFGWTAVLTDEVFQAVRQRRGMDRGIERERVLWVERPRRGRRRLREGGDHREEQRQRQHRRETDRPARPSTNVHPILQHVDRS